MAVTLADVQREATGDFCVWIRDRRNRRQIPHRFERCRYVPVRNENADDGLWRITTVRRSDDRYGGETVETARQVIYAKAELSIAEQLRVAAGLAALGQSRKPKSR
jgi:hypothetical protein